MAPATRLIAQAAAAAPLSFQEGDMILTIPFEMAQRVEEPLLLHWFLCAEGAMASPGGGAPRSESEISMIAGGNHTEIDSCQRARNEPLTDEEFGRKEKRYGIISRLSNL